MEWLSAFLASIIRPIIQDEFKEYRKWIIDGQLQLERFKEHDKEAQELIERIANASTSEERWAHLRDLRARRAKLNI